MTGFGRAQVSGPGGAQVTVDIKAVNHRYLSVQVRMPEPFMHRSQEIEAVIKGEIARGSVSYFLKVTLPTHAECFDVDTPLLEKYLKVIRKARSRLAPATANDEVSIETIMSLPGVIVSGENQTDAAEKLWPAIVNATNKALRQMKAMRRAEGKNISRGIKSGLHAMDRIVRDVKREAPSVVNHYKERLLERTRHLLEGTSIAVEEADLLRELAIFSERSSMDEEITRLKSHFEQARHALASREPVGRQLEFLSQEMLRETNTMAAKAGDAGLSQRVLELKGEVDKFREQAFNIE
jgi:uncharacterized protein (TIGR00255 family)